MLQHVNSFESLLQWLAFVGAIGFLICGRLLFKSVRLYVSYRDIAKDVKNIAQALLAALIKEGSIHTDPGKLQVESLVDSTGAVYCHLEGGTTYEKSLFIKSLQEIIDPVDSPRYLIIRRSKLFGLLSQRDYHSVPELLDKNKSLSEYFAQKWQELVGSCDLVFTRTIEGRKLLLKARLHSLAAQFQARTQRVNKWR